MTLLPEDFKPGPYDVICGRGKKCYNHEGNERFRERVVGMLDEYSRAKSKLDKSGVLASVVDQIRAISPNGGFVKQNENGRWYEVGDFLAREKTSQAFRDALHERYKSSNVSKKKRRQEEQARATDRFQTMAMSMSGEAVALGFEHLSLAGDMTPHGVPSNANLRAYDIYRANSLDAASRLNRLTDMRHRLHKRFAARSVPMPRPSSAMAAGTYPDPLFGNAQATSANVFPSPDVASSQMLQFESVARRPGSTPPMMNGEQFGNLQQQQPEPEMDISELMEFHQYRNPRGNGASASGSFSYNEEPLHHSMPNIHLNCGYDPYDQLNVTKSMHNSAPTLAYDHYDGGDSMSSGLDVEPIPLDEITPRPGAKKSISRDDFKKAISMTLSPTSPSAAALSKDLLACLDKLTGSSIKDGDNPFDPLPLVGEGDEDDQDEMGEDTKPPPFDGL